MLKLCLRSRCEQAVRRKLSFLVVLVMTRQICGRHVRERSKRRPRYVTRCAVVGKAASVKKNRFNRSRLLAVPAS